MSDNTRWQDFNSIIDNEGLQAKEKLLLLTIFRYFNSEKGYSFPSKETLKKLCGITQDRDYYKYIKNLESKKYLIKETLKGKGCKFYLNNLQNDTHCQNDSNLQNDSNTHCQNDSQPTCKMTVQKENKRKVKENNIYSLIFDYWISKNIKKHRNLTNDMKKAIDKTLKEYSKDEILEAISNYSIMYNDQDYKWCSYQWGLNEFLIRKDKDGIRQLGLFLNDGSKYLNYLKAKQLKEKNSESDKPTKLRGWD